MADGVENSCVLVSFNTPAYSASLNCSKELKYAHIRNTLIQFVNVRIVIVIYNDNSKE